MRQFTNKKANEIEEAIIKAIAKQVERDDTFAVDITVNDTVIILDGTCEIEESYDDSDNSVTVESATVMINNFNAYDLDGYEEKEVDVDLIKIEEEVEKLVA